MFKDSFKYYKSRLPPPDFDDVVDFRNVDLFKNKVRRVHAHRLERQFASLLQPVSEWRIFELIDKPGLLFVVNPWTELGVRYWVSRCLSQLTAKPSKLNIDYDCDDDGGWWNAAHAQSSGGALLRRLRWATFGYHHNWNTKEYSEDNKCEFAADLAAVCRYVADVVGGWSEFTAQAAILNFYHADSTLSGHRDHSEPNMAAPLLSFSFGQSAVFLVGGATLAEPALPVFVDNGDVMIMSAAARSLYHGVPRIVTSRWSPAGEQDGVKMAASDIGKMAEAGFDSRLLSDVMDDSFWRPFCDYVAASRINMNVRQVLCQGQTRLLDS